MPNTPTKIVKSLVIIAVLFVVALNCQNVGKRDKSCHNVVSQLNKLQIVQINKCAAQLGFTTTKEKLKKSNCILKCVLQSIGVMHQDGSVSVAKLDQYIDINFPSNLRHQAHTTFTPCLKLVQPTSTPVSDNYCQSQEHFIKCMTRNFFKLCHRQ